MVGSKIIGFYVVATSVNKDGFCMVIRDAQLMRVLAAYWSAILAISTIVFYLNRAFNAIVKKGVKACNQQIIGYDHGNSRQSSSTNRNCIHYYG